MIYQNATSIPAHFGDVHRGILTPREYGQHQLNPIEYKLTYVNNLPCDVVIAWRSGLKFRLPSVPNMLNDKFIARVEITIHPSVRIDIERVLSVLEETASSELKAMREALSFEVKENRHGGAHLVLDYALSLDKIREFGGTIYYHELDTVISLMPFEQVPPHPYSEEGLKQQVVAGSLLTDGVGFGYSVEIIDNSSKHGERFINIGGRVYKVSPKKDYTRRNGIYVLSNHYVDETNGISGIDTKYYPFDSAEAELGLYRSYEEALHRGDLNTARKQEITTLEHEITLHKTQLARARQEHEQEMLAKEKELKIVSAEQDRRAQELKELRERLDFDRDVQRNRLKDHYEDKSHVRKDQSEVVKFIPAVIVGIGAVIMALKAIF